MRWHSCAPTPVSPASSSNVSGHCSALWSRSARAGEATIREFVARTINRERRTGNGHALDSLDATHGIPTPPGRAVLHDIMWTLMSPEVADRLIRRCGWSPDDYERWLGDHLVAAVTP